MQIGGTFKFIKTYEDHQERLQHGHHRTRRKYLRTQPVSYDPRTSAIPVQPPSTLTTTHLLWHSDGWQTLNSDYNSTIRATHCRKEPAMSRHYRYYQTQLYLGDTWKVNSSLTLSYGVNYQLFSVPYETQGLESIEQSQL